MQVELSELAKLIELQQLDLDLIRAQKKLDGLPQRRRILELRKKKGAIEEKEAQVGSLLKEAEQELSLLNDEDERLVAKQAEVQQKIDECQGDYRSVEAHTKELGGIAKRRNKLESDLGPLDAKIAQINQMDTQVRDVLQQVSQQEAEAIASFQKEGGALTSQIAQTKARRAELAAGIDAGLLDAYERKAQRGGGIGIARLREGSCSVCRNPITEGKLLQVQGEAPLSECPSCKRLLVVVQ